MRNKNDKVSERQAKQTEVDAYSDAMLPEHDHVDDVGGNGNKDTQQQEVHVDEFPDVFASFVGNQIFRVVLGYERRVRNQKAAFWSLESLCDVVDTTPRWRCVCNYVIK